MRNGVDDRQMGSTLNAVDKECTNVMGCLSRALDACFEHGLDGELNAVYEALCVLHKNAFDKFKAEQKEPCNAQRSR